MTQDTKKIILITGASSGTGYERAKLVAASGIHFGFRPQATFHL